MPGFWFTVEDSFPTDEGWDAGLFLVGPPGDATGGLQVSDLVSVPIEHGVYLTRCLGFPLLNLGPDRVRWVRLHVALPPDGTAVRVGGRVTKVDVDELVAAYWRNHALSSGDRQQRLAAADDFWAWEAVSDAMGGPDSLSLLDALLAAPAADPCAIGAGPLEDLLSEHGLAWDTAVADRCRTSPLWRAAVACVWLDAHESQGLSALALYLPKSAVE